MRTRLLTALLLVFCAAAARADSVSEAEVKLALSYKVARFVTWPGAPDAEPFRLCVAGKRSVELASQRLVGRRISQRDIDVVRVSDASPLADCDALYVTESERERATDYQALLSGEPVLVISDAPGFAEAGGMVGLSLRGKRIGLTINVAAYQQAGLRFSSQLLELATLVDEAPAT